MVCFTGLPATLAIICNSAYAGTMVWSEPSGQKRRRRRLLPRAGSARPADGETGYFAPCSRCDGAGRGGRGLTFDHRSWPGLNGPQRHLSGILALKRGSLIRGRWPGRRLTFEGDSAMIGTSLDRTRRRQTFMLLGSLWYNSSRRTLPSRKRSALVLSRDLQAALREGFCFVRRR